MCANYELVLTPQQILDRFGLPSPREYHESINLRPDNAVLVITRDGAVMRRWGLKASWDNKLIINARSETIEEKSSFRPLLENRCLIPATGWFEWQAIEGAKRKRKHRLQPDGQQSFSFAGLTDGERVVMLTRAPAAEIAHVHDRMPAVLAREDERRWIEGKARFETVKKAIDGKAERFAAEPLEPLPPVRPRQQSLFD